MTYTVQLSLAHLAHELDAAGRTLADPALASLLGSVEKTKPPENQQGDWPEPADRGQALRALSGTSITHLKSFGVAIAEEHFIFADKSGKSLLLLSTDGASARIEAMLTPEDTFGAFAAMLRPTEAAPPLAWDRSFSLPGFQALAAIVDQYRTLLAATLVERRTLDLIAFTTTDLLNQLKMGQKVADFRWLNAMLPHMGLDFPKPTKKALIEGCDQLVSQKLLLRTGKSNAPAYIPSDQLLELGLHLYIPVPAMIVRGKVSRDHPAGKRTLFLSGRTAWSCTMSGKKLQLQCVDGLELVSKLASEMGLFTSPGEAEPERAAPRQAKPKQAKPSRTKPSQGEPSKPDLQATAPSEQPPKASNAKSPAGESAAKPKTTSTAKKMFCTKCGKALKPNAQFCTKCGHSIKQ